MYYIERRIYFVGVGGDSNSNGIVSVIKSVGFWSYYCVKGELSTLFFFFRSFCSILTKPHRVDSIIILILQKMETETQKKPHLSMVYDLFNVSRDPVC